MTDKKDKYQQERTPPVSIVIFGASGDLTQRKLIPALFSLACNGLLSSEANVIGVARTEFDDGDFREHLKEGIKEYARLQPDDINEHWQIFAKHISYLTGDYNNPDTYLRLEERLNNIENQTKGNRLFHMAIPPTIFASVVKNLGQSGLNQNNGGWARIVVEKPFGENLESACELNRTIYEVFNESQVYRIDHYLGKETVQNLLTLRFANAIFEPIWNRNYIDNVQITVAESVGVGNRAGFYDQVGVLRDMFQNHMMQLLALTAMEPPIAFEENTFRDKKINALQAIRPIDRSLKGQYTGNNNFKAYREENGVDTDSKTATFGAVKLYIDNWRWKNVPFYLRSGKRLASKSTSIVIEFKQVPHLMFPVNESGEIPPNIFFLCIQPNEGINLHLQTKKPGSGMETQITNIDYAYAQDFDQEELPTAYENLLVDAICGDATLFTRADEIEQAWRIIDPILESWESPDGPPCYTYESGGWGPDEADQFIEMDGRHWHYGCGE